MARRRHKEGDEPALKPPPCYLATKAADRRTIWVLDVHTPWGRRVHFGPLVEVEAAMDAYTDERGDAPDHTMWLFPVETSYKQQFYRKLSKRGWMRSTRWEVA